MYAGGPSGDPTWGLMGNVMQPGSMQGLMGPVQTQVMPQQFAQNAQSIQGGPWSQLAYQMAGRPNQNPFAGMTLPPATAATSPSGGGATALAGTALGILGALANNPSSSKSLGSTISSLLGGSSTSAGSSPLSSTLSSLKGLLGSSSTAPDATAAANAATSSAGSPSGLFTSGTADVSDGLGGTTTTFGDGGAAGTTTTFGGDAGASAGDALGTTTTFGATGGGLLGGDAAAAAAGGADAGLVPVGTGAIDAAADASASSAAGAIGGADAGAASAGAGAADGAAAGGMGATAGAASAISLAALPVILAATIGDSGFTNSQLSSMKSIIQQGPGTDPTQRYNYFAALDQLGASATSPSASGTLFGGQGASQQQALSLLRSLGIDPASFAPHQDPNFYSTGMAGGGNTTSHSATKA